MTGDSGAVEGCDLSSESAELAKAQALCAEFPEDDEPMACKRRKLDGQVPDAAKEARRGAKPLKVNGPSTIQTLRGRLQGREVALVLCGESHEDAIDLTRRRGVVAAEEGWIAVDHCRVFDAAKALASKGRLSLRGAQRWAKEILEETEEDAKIVGAHLVFEPRTRTRGTASVYLPSIAAVDSTIGVAHGHGATSACRVFRYGDLDKEAREFNERRMKPKDQRDSVEQQDALIRKRKAQRRAEGFELFDDWLLRQASSKDVHVEVVLEAPVRAEELQLHESEALRSAPSPPERLEAIALDSEEDEDEAATPGAGAYLDFLRRRLLAELGPRLHGVDARGLGDSEDEHLPKNLRGSFDALRSALPRTPDEDPVLPSWEAFFGGAADLLYYAPHVKADYAPFLKSCMGSAANMRRFFRTLFFESVPEALALLKIEEDTRRCCHVRAPTYRPASSSTAELRPEGRCHSGRRTLPVRVAPLQRYLVARGFDKPRTWVAGIAERLRQRGAGALVESAQCWYLSAVDRMLADPKGADAEGDNFVAWLRAVLPEVFRDIDTYDPPKLRRKHWARSRTSKRRYNLKDIRIPSIEEAFRGFCRAKRSTAREQVLSKIMVDIFQLRSVDLAMILKAAEAGLEAPKGQKVVVVCYGGLDHTRNVARFFRAQGFSAEGLPRKGLLGREEFEEDERRTLALPPYLQNLEQLFPVPAVKDATKRRRRTLSLR
ncbi:unnamed protein product [Effrenium voratum]|nr:unnamed protein product [Effrenium voratum]